MTENKNEWMHPDDELKAEIKHLVDNTDLSLVQARGLVSKHGADRNKLMKIAESMKAER